MPNWCDNQISVRALPTHANDFAAFKTTLTLPDAEGNVVCFSFHQAVPRPIDQEENWYEWNTANWGTKWDVSHDPEHFNGTQVCSYPDIVGIDTTTAWGPPGDWAERVANKYNVEINIEYETEDGEGRLVYYPGRKVRSFYWEKESEDESEDANEDFE